MQEIRQIIKGDNIEFSSLKDENLQDVDIVEDGETFEENALIKARAISKITGTMVIADDSGLEVDYMDKAPGVYSSRFLGEDTSYNVKNNHIITRLEHARGEERSARFVCVMACVFPDGREFVTRGTIEGRIDYDQRGVNGFGYDPIFYVPELGCTTAELSPEHKNDISHRGKALRAMYEKLSNEGMI